MVLNHFQFCLQIIGCGLLLAMLALDFFFLLEPRGTDQQEIKSSMKEHATMRKVANGGEPGCCEPPCPHFCRRTFQNKNPVDYGDLAFTFKTAACVLEQFYSSAQWAWNFTYTGIPGVGGSCGVCEFPGLCWISSIAIARGQKARDAHANQLSGGSTLDLT